MFATIRRHQQWLLYVIIVVVIIAFVYYFNPTQRAARGRNDAANQLPEINGKVVTQKMLNDSAREVRLLYFLNTGKWPEEDTERAQQMNFDLETESYYRLFRVGKALEAGVHVSDKTVADFARRLLGGGGEAELDRFVKERLTPRGLTADDFERFVRNDAIVQQFSQVVGAAGRLVTPGEAEGIYRREHQEIGGDIVFFALSNYLGKVVVTNGALTNWYALQQAKYRTPEKVRVSYVEFSKTNFYADADKRMAEVTNLTAQLRDIYYKAGPNSFKDTNGVPLSETNALAKIKEEQRDHLSRMLAARKANEFANQLDDMKPARAENLSALAASNSLTVQVSMAFDREEGPTNLDVSPKFANTAFSLNASNQPVSVQPVEGENGFYLLALKETIPSRLEPYAAVADKVADDFKRYNAFTLAYAEATNFIAQANTGLATGKTFEETAQKAGLKVETLPPISQATESLTNLEERLDVRTLKSVMFRLEPGKLSTYQPNPPEGGYVVYVRGKLPLDDAKVRAELPRFLAELRYHKQNQNFNVWFNKQAELAKLPVNNRQKRPGTK